MDKQTESREHSGRPASDHDYRLALMDILIVRSLVFLIWFIGIISPYLIADEDIPAGIYGTVDNMAMSIRPGEGRLDRLGRVYHIDHGVPAQMQGLGGGQSYVVKPRLPPYTAAYFEFYHRLYFKNQLFSKQEPHPAECAHPSDT